MKKLKMKLLTLGVLATVIMSSTPVFAATKTSTSNASTTTKTIATSNTTSASKTPTIPRTIETASYSFTTSMYYARWSTVANSYPTLYPSNSYNQLVHTLQYELRNCGYNVSEDGYFGSQTEAAVIAAQNATSSPIGWNTGTYQPISADGIVGPNTWGKIFYLFHAGVSN
ncbi:peptidoglycan-binding domain-containing protein [Clostridium akagii]|uniref:peptidoglycan-binding domain-containing protein n=1 Tax=Clostridium akagii TaxID=91623 RepID=UPI00055AF9C1|nr:peptidoglycan-binding domain-containing protein [Clostridium akagii]